MAYDPSLSPELNLARQSTTGAGDPLWVQQLRAQYARREALELQNPLGVRARDESTDAARRRDSEYLFALATGATGAQLGTEGARTGTRTYLDPAQSAQLIALRDGPGAGAGGDLQARAADLFERLQQSPLALVAVAVAGVLVLKRLGTGTLVLAAGAAGAALLLRRREPAA